MSYPDYGDDVMSEEDIRAEQKAEEDIALMRDDPEIYEQTRFCPVRVEEE